MSWTFTKLKRGTAHSNACQCAAGHGHESGTVTLDLPTSQLLRPLEFLVLPMQEPRGLFGTKQTALFVWNKTISKPHPFMAAIMTSALLRGNVRFIFSVILKLFSCSTGLLLAAHAMAYNA
jgi:hypothetical protein